MVIHKIGIVPVARMREAHSNAPDEVLHALIHKPKAKDGAEVDIAWGLARGTRMYFDAHTQQWHDARERSTAEAYRDCLESVEHTALREMVEELDVRIEDIVGGVLTDIGAISYDSAQRMAYPIHWFSGVVHNPERGRSPEDAAGIRWVSLTTLHAMAQNGEFKASYVPIVEAVLERMSKP